MFTKTQGRVVTRDRRLQGRRMVLVDVENVVGGVVDSDTEAYEARCGVDEAIELRVGDHVVIATGHQGLIDTGRGWPDARYLVRSGPNGADLALLDVLASERVAERFCEVVLVSGDGIFADAVADLAAVGVQVTVVSRRESCSGRLRMAASRTVFLDEGALRIGGVA